MRIMTKYCKCFAIAIGLLFGSQPAVAVGQDAVLQHRGFSLNISQIGSPPNRAELLESLKNQIDLVLGVKLDQERIAFFRTVPIIVVPLDPTRPSFPTSYYSQQDSTIIVRPRLFNPANAILLHEFLHAYHHQRLPSGMANPELRDLYAQAKARQIYPANADVMENEQEYFALSGSVFLHGRAARDPFTRENVKAKHPELYDWLEREFGPR